MGLIQEYPEKFERVWRLWPRWPTGRSIKALGYKAFQQADKVLKFTDKDIDDICADVQARLLNCETWQTGNKYGPPAISKYFNQRLWGEPYIKKGSYRPTVAAHQDFQYDQAPSYQGDPEKAKAALEQARKELH